MRKNMKLKSLVTALAMAIPLCVGTVALANGQNGQTEQTEKNRYTVTNTVADTLGVSFNINAPIVVKTTAGEDISGSYLLETVNDMKSLLQTKGAQGLRAKNSKKPRTNLLILRKEDADLFVKLVKLQNQATANSKSGPMYQVESVSSNCLNEASLKALRNVGINEPVVLLVESGKKVQPGGWFRKVGDILNPFREAAGLLGDWRTWKGWN